MVSQDVARCDALPAVTSSRPHHTDQNLHGAIGATNIPSECIQGYEISTAEDVVEVLKHEEDPRRILQLLGALHMVTVEELQQRWRVDCYGMMDEGLQFVTVSFDEYILDLRIQFVMAACLVYGNKADTYADAWEQVYSNAHRVALEAVQAIHCALQSTVRINKPR